LGALRLERAKTEAHLVARNALRPNEFGRSRAVQVTSLTGEMHHVESTSAAGSTRQSCAHWRQLQSQTTGDMSNQVGQDNKLSRSRHLGEQGRQGNIKQNTTNQGYTQDR
jgi:hypothetical protein